MSLTISNNVKHKLSTKHNVRECEILECFANREGGFLTDIREEHLTDPPSNWFIAETDYGRKLKVVFMQYPETGEIVIKTTYEANAQEIEIYNKYA